MSCVFCTDPSQLEICKSCSRSYDCSRGADDGTIFASMRWAANRVRRTLSPLLVTPRKLQTLIAYIKTADEVATFVDTESWVDSDAACPVPAMQRMARARGAVCKAWGTKPSEGR